MATSTPRPRRAALVLCALLGACGGDAPADRGAAGGDHATLGGGPPGGVLVVLADREPDQLNPLTFSSTPAWHAVHLMFRALAARDSTLSGYQPDLARSWRLVDDSTVVLELRDDVWWHDGRRVSAADVVFTIERQRDPTTGSPRQADVAAVTSVMARDSFTVVVGLSRTGLYAVNALLEVVPVPRHLLADVPPEQLRNAPFGRNPVGNGFYRFGSWVANQSLTLLVDTAKPDGRAAIERIVMRFTPDMSAAVTQLMAGHGDLIAKLPPDQRAAMEAAPGVRVYAGPRVRPTWLAWNTRRPPLDDVRVRRALLMAIDREGLARWLSGDDAEPALTPIPKVLREHSPGVRPIPFDTAGARRLLAEAGWRDTDRDGIVDRNGRPLRVEVEYISSDLTRQNVLVAIQSMLRAVGVDLAPRAYESTTWVQHLREGSFTGSFWGWGWGPGVVGPNAEMIFHSRSIPPNGPNFAAARHPRIDALIDQALVAADTARQRAIWQELEQLMIDDAVYAPIYMDPELFAVHARFRNVRFRGIEWTEDVPYWYVDPADRLTRDRSR
ncbi:MAG TPA: ABC transporter substrate-binding protein [Longimicrobiales bacterium]|nr:ABC transporter substrate-binding protein [Longimicrobiales bacterium]